MNDPIRVLAYSATSDDLKWLIGHEQRLAEWNTSVQIATNEKTDEAFEPHLLLLDESLGMDSVRSLLSEFVRAPQNVPVLLAIKDASWYDFESMIRYGAAEIVLKETDSAFSLQRTFSSAIARSSVLRATEDAERQIRSLLEGLSDGLIILDKSDIVLYVNPMAEQLLGTSLNNLFGLTSPVKYTETEPSYLTQQIGQGPPSTLSVQTSPIQWDHMEARVLLLRDVTHEQAAYDLLMSAKKSAEEAGRVKSAFLANMSHELRIPLASIIGFAQLIEEGDLEPDFVEFAQLIRQSGNRLLDSINAVLEASRLEQHTIVPRLERIDLSSLILSVSKRLQPIVHQKHTALVTNGPGHVWVEADADFTERILNNLIGNAARFTESGRITISWEVSGVGALVHVSDTGIGIDPQFLETAFSAFTQENSSSGSNNEGFGLGLSIVKTLLEAMQGTISVKSVKDEGSIFTFRLPLSS